MQTDFLITTPEVSPAFFFHLGDVIYGPNKDQDYRPEFYEPYVHYPGKIVAIAGNHDGEVFPTTDPVTLRAFLSNFCAASQVVPPIAGTIFRQTMNQPGVYYLLDAPFMQIVALYSNAAENPGFISGPIPGQAQKTWLLKALKAIAAQRKAGSRKALIFATHHPPFTAGGHSPSTDMLADIDSVCQQAGILPDLFLSGHSHNYQRYTREQTPNGRKLQIPYIVAGTGGIGAQPSPPPPDRSPETTPSSSPTRATAISSSRSPPPPLTPPCSPSIPTPTPNPSSTNSPSTSPATPSHNSTRRFQGPGFINSVQCYCDQAGNKQ